jgi:hypothetical protein
MTRKRLLRAICCGLLLVASAVPAGAQPAGMQRVTDSKGRFAISFPIGWEVMSMNANMLTGEVTRNLPKDFFSMLMAVDPANPESPTVVMIMGFTLPRHVSPQTFGTMMSEPLATGKLERVAVVKEGNATIAGRPAFYRYFTAQTKSGDSLYNVMVSFTAGQDGYLILGVTRNVPETFRRSFDEISQILETFRPIAKHGASVVPVGGALVRAR